MKIYLVRSDWGSYEDHHKLDEGIFSDPFKAEELRRKIETTWKALKDLPIPCDLPQNEYSVNLWAEKWDQYWEAYNFNSCNVVEYELDQIINKE